MVSIKFCFYGIELLWLCFHRLFFTWLGNCSQPICTQLSLVPASQCSLCKTNDVFQLIRTQLNDSLIGSIKRMIISFRRLECDQLFGFFSSNERDQIQTMNEGSIDMSLRHSNWSLSHFLALVSSCQKLLPFIANQLTVCCFRCGRKKAIKKRKIGFYFLCCGVASASQFHSYLF